MHFHVKHLIIEKIYVSQSDEIEVVRKGEVFKYVLLKKSR